MVLTMCGLACGCEGSLPLFSAAAREPLQQWGNADTNMSDISTDLQAQRWSPDCVNAAGKARQKWEATAGTNFNKSGDRLLAEPCIVSQKELVM